MIKRESELISPDGMPVSAVNTSTSGRYQN